MSERSCSFQLLQLRSFIISSSESKTFMSSHVLTADRPLMHTLYLYHTAGSQCNQKAGDFPLLLFCPGSSLFLLLSWPGTACHPPFCHCICRSSSGRWWKVARRASLPPPLVDFCVVSGEQDLRYGFALILYRTGILRIFQQAVVERIFLCTDLFCPVHRG